MLSHRFTKKRACEFLNNRMPDEDAIDDELVHYRLQADDIHQATLKVILYIIFATCYILLDIAVYVG